MRVANDAARRQGQDEAVQVHGPSTLGTWRGFSGLHARDGWSLTCLGKFTGNKNHREENRALISFS